MTRFRCPLSVLLAFAVAVPVGAQSSPSPPRQVYTTEHRFLIKLLAAPRAPRLEQYFTVRLGVYDGHDPKRRLTDFQVDVAAGMAHGMTEGFAHGMQSEPHVELRDGVVIVSGLLFAMSGEWTMRVTVHHGGEEGTASFQLPCCAKDDRGSYTSDELAAIYSHSPLGPLPPDPTNRVADDLRAATLGQSLFFDGRFSANGKVSCASCHQPALAFTDARSLAEGMAVGTRNSPTVLNAAFGQWYFLDGRSDSLWSQALQPFENPKEVGGDRQHIVLALGRDPALRQAYERVFGALPGQSVDRVFSNLGKAIEAYERRLRTPPAPFDRYVAALKSGDARGQRILSASAKRGLQLFVGAARCDLCHSGPAFSDGLFHNLGLPVGSGEALDAGREVGIRGVRTDPFNGMGVFSDAPRKRTVRERLAFLPAPESQAGAFKTPTLREVARTAPYMHDGRFTDLGQVLSFYAGATAAPVAGTKVGQRERTLDLVPPLTQAQQLDLIEFLQTLTSPALPRVLTRPPTLPVKKSQAGAILMRAAP
jgi:cytochrome c peroxidase